jgi:hypothetical protein
VRCQDRRAEVRRVDLANLPGAARVIDELADALDGIDVISVARMVATPMTELENEDPSEHPKPEFSILRPGDDARLQAASLGFVCLTHAGQPAPRSSSTAASCSSIPRHGRTRTRFSCVRICIVYDCLYPHTVGGAERWYRNVALRLAEDGHEVTYLTMRQWDAAGGP